MLLQLGTVDIPKFYRLGNNLLTGRIKIEILLIYVVNALETLADIDRPTERTYRNLQLRFYLIEQVERVLTFTVELIDENDNRRLAHAAHFHQFTRLCFNAFCYINYDNNTVDSRQCAVSIFGKILVSGRVENIYFIIAVIESHHRSGYRYTSLLLDFHPVRGSGFLYLVRFHGSGNMDSAAEKQKFLGKGRFTRIGVADNSKCASFLNLFGKCTHVVSVVFSFDSAIWRYTSANFPPSEVSPQGKCFLSFSCSSHCKKAAWPPRDSRPYR